MLCLYGIPVYMIMCVCVCVHVFLMLFHQPFSFCLFCLLPIGLVLFYLMFYYCFLTEIERDWIWGGGEELGGVAGGDTVIRMYYVEKIHFQ